MLCESVQALVYRCAYSARSMLRALALGTCAALRVGAWRCMRASGGILTSELSSDKSGGIFVGTPRTREMTAVVHDVQQQQQQQRQHGLQVHANAHAQRWRVMEAALCALAIMTSLMLYSVLQERIMTRPYEPLQQTAFVATKALVTAAYFKNSLFLVLANRLAAALVAVLCIAARASFQDFKSNAPFYDYVSISLSNVIATSCQYEALKWLTFPTVTIGKCAKMLPVMIILNFKKKRRYSFADFAVVTTVMMGCAIMISSGNVAAKRMGAAEEDTLYGFALLVAYLLFDAITSTYQQRLFERYEMSVLNQMLFINVSSAILSFIGLLSTGGLSKSIQFVQSYPRSLPDIATLSLSAVAGQFAISYTIQSFGALLYAGIMTTRQFFSVLASDIIFKHGLTAVQWTGAFMVFAALFFKLWRKAVRGVE